MGKKRLIDTQLFHKRFFRNLSPQHKVFWLFLICECDHSGIWNVDEEFAEICVGRNGRFNIKEALRVYNEDELRILVFDSGKKWLIIPFVKFQYGVLQPSNRVHKSVIENLMEYGVYDYLNDEYVKSLRPIDDPLMTHTRPIDGSIDNDIDNNKDNNIDKGKEENKEEIETESEVPVEIQLAQMYNEICRSMPKVLIKMLEKNKNRREALANRIEEIGGLEKCKEILIKASKSDFLSGRSGEWRCNLDWLFFFKNNWIKVLEGNYDNIEAGQKGKLSVGQVHHRQEDEMLEKLNF